MSALKEVFSHGIYGAGVLGDAVIRTDNSENELRDEHGRWTAGGAIPASLRPKLKDGLYPKSAELHEAAADPAKLEALFKRVPPKERGKLMRLMEQLKPKESLSDMASKSPDKWKEDHVGRLMEPLVKDGTPNDCFENARREYIVRAEKGEDVKYVVGTLYGLDHDAMRKIGGVDSDAMEKPIAPVPHAWIEVGGNIVDPTPFKHGTGNYADLLQESAKDHFVKALYVPDRRVGASQLKHKLSYFPSQESHADAVHAIVKKLAGSVNLASMPKVREALGHLSKEQQDAALLDLHRQGKIGFSGWEGRHGIKPEEKEALLDVGGQQMGHVYVRNEELRDERGRWTNSGSMSFKVAPEVEDYINEYFEGRLDKHDVAKCAGSLPGAKVTVSVSHATGKVRVEIEHPEYKATRYLGKDFVTNELLEATERRSGVGTRVLAVQVKAAADAGFKELRTHAAGGPGEEYNGYYTWPRLGYDANVDSGFSDEAREYAEKRGLKKLSDFMRDPEHREWWKQHGSGVYVKFDLSEGSLGRRVLDAYAGATARS